MFLTAIKCYEFTRFSTTVAMFHHTFNKHDGLAFSTILSDGVQFLLLEFSYTMYMRAGLLVDSVNALPEEVFLDYSIKLNKPFKRWFISGVNSLW